jgi:CheY-like chemotaxis protein
MASVQKLKSLVVADPLEDVARGIADACERLAEQRLVVTSGAEALERVKLAAPDVLIISLELTKPETVEVVPRIAKSQPETLMIATYRELAVHTMEKLARHGIDHFVPQPVDITEVFRAASRRFQMHFRRHDRLNTTLEVYRADGVLIGRTRDVSEGGMFMDAIHPVRPDESQLLDLMLNDGREKPLRVRCRILQVDGAQPAPLTARIQFEKLWGPDHKRLVDYIQTLLKTDNRASSEP